MPILSVAHESATQPGGTLLLQFLAQLVATLVGAGVGASSVFRVQARKKREDRDEVDRELWRRRAEAGRAAQFVLGCQRRTLAMLWEGDIQRHARDPERWWKVRATVSHHSTPGLDLAVLSTYLLGCDPNLLDQLYVAQATFQVVVGMIQDRNQSFGEFQSRVAARIASGEAFEQAVVSEAKEPLLAPQLIGITDDLYEAFKRAEASSAVAFCNLRSRLEKDMGGRGEPVLDTELPEFPGAPGSECVSGEHDETQSSEGAA